VNFPLHQVKAQPAETKEKEKTDDAWEQAKREYYGEPSPERIASAYAEPYDGDKVNLLKTTLLEALNSAANLHGLSAKDFVTICVSGSANLSAAPARGSTSPVIGQFAPSPYVGPEIVTQRSFLTLRAAKSDIDAFASGKMDSAEFSRAAMAATYVGEPGRWSGGGAGYAPKPGIQYGLRKP
jgi:hypothetical protein